MATFTAVRETGLERAAAAGTVPPREETGEGARTETSGLLGLWWRGWVAWASDVAGRGGLR